MTEGVAFSMLREQLNRVENKVDVLGVQVSELRGERRATKWFIGAAGGFGGAILAFIGNAWMHRP